MRALNAPDGIVDLKTVQQYFRFWPVPVAPRRRAESPEVRENFAASGKGSPYRDRGIGGFRISDVAPVDSDGWWF